MRNVHMVGLAAWLDPQIPAGLDMHSDPVFTFQKPEHGFTSSPTAGHARMHARRRSARTPTRTPMSSHHHAGAGCPLVHESIPDEQMWEQKKKPGNVRENKSGLDDK